MALRAVPPGTKAPPKTVTEAAAHGSQRDLLVAMRDRIAKAVESDKCLPRDLAALSLRLQNIVNDIEAIKARDAEEAGRGEVPDEAFDAAAL